MVRPKKVKRAENRPASARRTSRTPAPVITNLYSPEMDEDKIVTLLLNLLGVEDRPPDDGLEMVKDEGLVH